MWWFKKKYDDLKKKYDDIDKDVKRAEEVRDLLTSNSEMTAIRNIELAISGDGVKNPSNSELKNLNIARKSIVAKRAIKKGEAFTIENITTKRPANGISAMKWNEVMGKTAKKDYHTDELIEIWK